MVGKWSVCSRRESQRKRLTDGDDRSVSRSSGDHGDPVERLAGLAGLPELFEQIWFSCATDQGGQRDERSS